MIRSSQTADRRTDRREPRLFGQIRLEGGDRLVSDQGRLDQGLGPILYRRIPRHTSLLPMLLTRRVESSFPATANDKLLVSVIDKAYRDILILRPTFTNPPDMFVETSAFRPVTAYLLIVPVSTKSTASNTVLFPTPFGPLARRSRQASRSGSFSLKPENQQSQ